MPKYHWAPLSTGHMFGILNLGYWDLFEPALVRLGWCMPSSVSGVEIVALNTSDVNSVWARDLDFGAWNFFDFDNVINFY
jgi:hypothetical protein